MITLSVDDQKSSAELMQFMLNNIDPEGTHMIAGSAEEALSLLNNTVQIVFFDIEMPVMNGIELAKKIREKYDRINIIFITGYIEYSYEAYSTHPSGFLKKPVCEQDIIHELNNLRFPINKRKAPLIVNCSPFAIFLKDQPYDFKRDRTIELFAYLVYRNGAFCTNGELLGALWGGDPEKQGYLRQLVMDMRECLREINSENIIIKKYGKIGININELNYEGNPADIIEEFHWI
ncbi:MAG: response regulator, partial [Ruminococcus sp.]|nr:response regulator [Ruminococcus sp.]